MSNQFFADIRSSSCPPLYNFWGSYFFHVLDFKFEYDIIMRINTEMAMTSSCLLTWSFKLMGFFHSCLTLHPGSTDSRSIGSALMSGNSLCQKATQHHRLMAAVSSTCSESHWYLKFLNSSLYKILKNFKTCPRVTECKMELIHSILFWSSKYFHEISRIWTQLF